MRYFSRSSSALAGMVVISAIAAGALPSNATTPTMAAVEPQSALGNYLAGRAARGVSDTAAAAFYFREALRSDPGNPVLAEQTFLMELSEAAWPGARALAERIAAVPEGNRLTRLYLSVAAFKAGDYAKADDHLRQLSTGPIGELTSMLVRAWIRLGQGNVDDAISILRPVNQADFIQHYSRFHRALIADIAGRSSEARSAYEVLFKSDPRTVRITLAYAHHAAAAGDVKLARAILDENIERTGGEGHPIVRALRDRLAKGEKLEPLVDTPAEGLAEVLYNLGEALSTEGGGNIGVIYLQLALYVKPDFPFALAALANVYESNRRYEAAIAAYERIPTGSPLDVSIAIRKAINLNLLDRPDEAKVLLDRVIADNPKDLRPLDAIGGILRARKRWKEAIEYYDRAIALIPKPEKKHWSYWYSRGTSYERIKQWPKAEADLLQAMKLNPDQPLVLNYLGYSWIDQNKNLKRGLRLIEKAVSLKPDDGYIVDSLGWAHYKLGNYAEAVVHLERAVELRPEDPILNDHLGDALWRVGREREARFQWEQALTLKPEPEDEVKIREKVANGLPSKRIVRPAGKGNEAARQDTTKKRVETQQSPANIQ